MSLDRGKMMIAYDRKRTSTLTLDEQPGARTPAQRGNTYLVIQTAT